MASVYRAYLRTFGGRVSEKTITPDRDTAESAFSALVNRTDLDGQKLAAALTFNNQQIAFHRFDHHPDDADYWRDRLDDIEWPDERPVGRPEEMQGGKRTNVYLSADSRAKALLIGKTVSEGIRLALAAYPDPS